MTTLADMMLETARLLGTVFEGEADSGTTTTLVDAMLKFPAGHFAGGTLWMLSGDNEGGCYPVTTSVENTLTIDTTLTDAIATGDAYAVATEVYPKSMLKQAVNYQLRQLIIPQVNTSMTVSTSGTLTLTSGIYNTKRILVGDEGQENPNYYWEERGGVLYFDQGRAPDTSQRITVWYAIPHGELADSGTVNDQVDREWLAWASVVYCMRNRLQLIKKDDPILIDFLNEAKMQEQQLRNKMKTSINMPRDPRLGSW